jgi:hypothetical protein
VESAQELKRLSDRWPHQGPAWVSRSISSLNRQKTISIGDYN